MADGYDWQGMLSQFQPTEEDRRRARQQAVVAAGLGLLGARRGQEWQAAGQAGLLGMGAYNQQLQDAARQRALGVETASRAATLQEMMRARQDQDAARKAAIEFYGGQVPGMPSAPAQAPVAVPTPSYGMQDRSAGMQPPPLPTMPASAMSNKRALYEQKMALAQLYARKGLVDAAAKAQDEAIKILPKRVDTKTFVDQTSGERKVVNIYDDGSQEVLPFAPDLEKAVFSHEGNVVTPRNPFTAQPVGGAIPIGLSPDTAADLPFKEDTRKQAWANYGLQRQKFDYEKEQGSKPVLQTDTEGNMYAVDPRSATGRTITGPTGEPLNKGGKPLTESQGKATAYANQMKNATDVLAQLKKEGFTSTGLDEQGRVAMAATEGIPFVPGTAAIPRLLAGEKAQVYQQAELQWTEAALRFMTGANAPEQEVRRNAATYFPRPGDDAARIKRKEEARAAMEQSIRMAAGTQGNKLLEQAPTLEQATRIKSDAEYNALPKGAIFIGPDGKRRRKP